MPSSKELLHGLFSYLDGEGLRHGGFLIWRNVLHFCSNFVVCNFPRTLEICQSTLVIFWSKWKICFLDIPILHSLNLIIFIFKGRQTPLPIKIVNSCVFKPVILPCHVTLSSTKGTLIDMEKKYAVCHQLYVKHLTEINILSTSYQVQYLLSMLVSFLILVYICNLDYNFSEKLR